MTRPEIAEALAAQMLSEAPAAPSQFTADIGRSIALGIARDIVASDVPVLQVERGKAIFCLRCGLTSRAPAAVAAKRCEVCDAD